MASRKTNKKMARMLRTYEELLDPAKQAGSFVKEVNRLAKERDLPISLAKNKVKGLAIKCVRDVKDGEVLFTDTTLLTLSPEKDTCEQCLAPLKDESKVACRRCNGSVYCCADCRDDQKSVHQEECDLLQRANVKKLDAPVQEAAYLLLRFEANLELCEEVIASEFRKPRGEQDPFLHTMLEALVALKDDSIDIGPEAVNAYLRSSCNTLTITRPDAEGLKCLSSEYTHLINHDCMPNAIIDAHTSVAQSKQTRAAKVVVRACRDIKAGEEISLSYVDTNLSTNARQRELQSKHGFRCRCDRCEDEDSLDDPLEEARCLTYGCGLTYAIEHDGKAARKCGQCGEVSVDG
eukprot:TRINITY_DN10051_c0_g1_i1.p1 TRINITY_DN10051_c0_g1~~TRINITY_DN10051_c0_g1_i1.p1  ORF type:complete len:349 (+),score=80.42 TRINITY_DN10051_c0_g1_i1:2-1048(+)